MSFLDDIKMYGLVAIVIGVLSIALGAYGAYDQDWELESFAPIVSGIMLLLVGYFAYSGQTKGKVNALSMYLVLVGIGFIIVGLLTLTAGILSIIIGLIAAFIGYRLGLGKKQSTLWYIILAIVFLIMIIVSFIGIFALFTGDTEMVISGVASIFSLVMYVYVLYFLFSDEVKAKF